MTWLQHHKQSEDHAIAAEGHLRRGERLAATRAYLMAAEAEDHAIADLDDGDTTVYGTLAVSATALFLKSADLERALISACRHLGNQNLPPMAATQLSELLQTIWSERTRVQSGLSFEPNQVHYSLRGGSILRGGAPLDLVVQISQRTESLFYRVSEYRRSLPHRVRGQASKAIREAHRPWLFQDEPGSFRFSVALQEPMQRDIFRQGVPTSAEIVGTSLEILRASVYSPGGALVDLVPDGSYRRTFLRFARDLSPTGKHHKRLEIRSDDPKDNIRLDNDTRFFLNDSIRALSARQIDVDLEIEQVVGTLRGVDLERDWLEVVDGSERIRVRDVGEAVDDLIGPLVNHSVIVTVAKDATGTLFYRDIELDD